MRFAASSLCVLGILFGVGCEASGASDAGHMDDGGPDSGALDDGSAPTDGGGRPVEDAGRAADPWAFGPSLGARRHANGDLELRVRAPNATRVEACFFALALGEAERLRVPLDLVGGRFELRVSAEALVAAGLEGQIFYGYRVFGPNWPYRAEWEPGSEVGRVADVDANGHRMNPNKLVLDPYALEVTHDPITPEQRDYGSFRTDAGNRARDSGPFAPKGVIVDVAPPSAAGPGRAARNEVIYEVHLRGLTMQDEAVPVAERGTYAGAARRAAYLRELGVTAIELLPLHETPNDQNELSADADGDNYWGYSTLSYFAPDRRLAMDRSPGGPTRELREMVEAFHAEGIEVLVDVVYNHTTEGGASGGASTILSWRGLDNATFYTLGEDASQYVNGNGVGPNLNVANPVVADMVVDSLRYWHEIIGVDGFRFDLMPISANRCDRGCYEFAPDGLPERIARALGRAEDGGPGALLIAEPWGLVAGSYQLGRFPDRWLEWNDRTRDTIRRDLNRIDTERVTPRDLARSIEGSPDLFGAGNHFSVNFVVAHDGFTLADLFRYDARNNTQAWPFGPSDGGSENNYESSHGGDAAMQGTATRSALALLALSAGVPMFTGGDEMLRTQRGNNNAYNLDSPGNWLDWSTDAAQDSFRTFTSRLLAFRNAHVALRPRTPWASGGDGDGDGRPEVVWLDDDAAPVTDAYLDDPGRHFLGWMLDADDLGDDAAAILVFYNGWERGLNVALPPPPAGARWVSHMDTTPLGDAFAHFHETPVPVGETYFLGARGVALLVAQ